MLFFRGSVGLCVLCVGTCRKLLVVGPHQSGKSRFANLMAGIQTQGAYDPTVGARILEFERTLTMRSKDGKRENQVAFPVECWDVSGDVKYIRFGGFFPVGCVPV
jgi:GTPase SAR1 family protein